jgi:putative ABC transport system substrate-binding protein
MWLLGCIVARPFSARAQQADQVKHIGVLIPLPRQLLPALFEELREQGFIEGQNLQVDERGFQSGFEQFSAIAEQLVRSKVDTILCAGEPATRAAQQATRRIPILAVVDDMIRSGLVSSFAEPGGNITGISILASELDSKRQEILADFITPARRIAVLADANMIDPRQVETLRTGSDARGLELLFFAVRSPEEIGPAIDAAKASGAAGLNVLASPFLHDNYKIIVDRARALRLPAIYQWPEIAEEGGLLGYGPRFSEIFRQWARQIAKVLRGMRPENLPVEQPTRFELVLNLAAVKSMGLAIPGSFSLRPDKVIE